MAMVIAIIAVLIAAGLAILQLLFRRRKFLRSDRTLRVAIDAPDGKRCDTVVVVHAFKSIETLLSGVLSLKSR